MTLAWLPNAITVLRMAMVPALLWLLLAGDYRPALVVALIAGLSDALDGWLAKRFGWQSRLGGLLDPIADKLLLNAGVIGLWAVDALPAWFAALVIGRDVVIVSGAVTWQLTIGPLQAAPTWLGKVTTFAQIALVLAVLLQLALERALPGIAVGVLLVAAVTALSGLDYVVRWSRLARAARKERP